MYVFCVSNFYDLLHREWCWIRPGKFQNQGAEIFWMIFSFFIHRCSCLCICSCLCTFDWFIFSLCRTHWKHLQQSNTTWLVQKTKFKVEGVTAKGLYVVFPFSRQQGGIASTTLQRLRLVKEEGSLLEKQHPHLLGARFEFLYLCIFLVGLVYGTADLLPCWM